MERMSQPLQISLSHYERLGVSSSADPETLRQAFRRRSKDLHPDTTMLPAEEAAIQFQLLRESYELLADPERRRVYDEQRTSASARPSQPTQRNDRDGWHGIGQRRPLSGGEWFSLLLLGRARFSLWVRRAFLIFRCDKTQLEVPTIIIFQLSSRIEFLNLFL